MKKILLTVMIAVLTIVLSSCAINVFKSLDKPSGISNLAKSALNAANNGDAQTSINLASDVITSAASSSTGTEVDLYNALNSPATSSKAKEVIEQTAYNVKAVESRIKNGEISLNSTTASAVKNAAIAMIRSISQVKNLSITNVVSTLLNMLPQSSSVSVESASPSFDASTASKIVVALLSVSRDMPTMDLLSELSSLLSVYGGKNEFNWDSANMIYNLLYVSTAFFDSNHDGVLNTSDEIFNYVWDKKNNKFKDFISQQEFEEMLSNVELGTYGNIEQSQIVIDKLYEAIRSAKDALNHIPSSLSIDTSSIENIINEAERILNGFDSNKLASLKTLGDLLNVLGPMIQQQF